ncbi:nucleotidyltransferase domain-containing protein [Sorangium sp. So ce1078]|uniref:nucleotidyltransferase domain-containing protein n=1 Tax=Sorangium sp. So ce1078 TaxID=3133329 RepID=UPI003F636D57
MNTQVLEAKQQEVAARVIAEEEARRPHLVIALSGAHAYGFPSPDSDLDLKAVHIEPTDKLLGLLRSSASPARMEVIDGVEIDYTSNEIHPVLLGVLQGNGNYIERIVGPLQLHVDPDLASLRPLVAAALSRRIFRHYVGFATSQLRAWEAGGRASAKKLLYVLRTTLTGAHALGTGEIVTDVTELLDLYGFGAARELIEAKRAGEKTELAPDIAARWAEHISRAFTTLEAAHDRAVLPDEPPNQDELNDWLLALRKARL